MFSKNKLLSVPSLDRFYKNNVYVCVYSKVYLYEKLKMGFLKMTKVFKNLYFSYPLRTTNNILVDTYSRIFLCIYIYNYKVRSQFKSYIVFYFLYWKMYCKDLFFSKYYCIPWCGYSYHIYLTSIYGRTQRIWTLGTFLTPHSSFPCILHLFSSLSFLFQALLHFSSQTCLSPLPPSSKISSTLLPSHQTLQHIFPQNKIISRK